MYWQVPYGSASFIGPVAGAGAVAIVIAIAATVGFAIFRTRKRRDMERIKAQMSDTQRRKKLAEGVVCVPIVAGRITRSSKV